MTYRCLGRRPTRHDARTLKLSDYFPIGQLAAPPPLRDWTGNAAPDFGMMLNDHIGDCVIATQAHLVQIWSSMRGTEITIPDRDVLNTYKKVGGYDGLNPSTDNGCVMLDAMNYWRQVGVGGHKIRAYVKIDPRSRMEVETAINLFGGVAVGADLPLAVQHQSIWDVAPPGKHTDEYNPGSWGGHAMACPVFSHSSVGFITWGKIKIASWSWWYTYVSEAYAAISDDWVLNTQAAPNGFDLAALESSLSAFAA